MYRETGGYIPHRFDDFTEKTCSAERIKLNQSQDKVYTEKYVDRGRLVGGEFRTQVSPSGNSFDIGVESDRLEAFADGWIATVRTANDTDMLRSENRFGFAKMTTFYQTKLQFTLLQLGSRTDSTQMGLMARVGLQKPNLSFRSYFLVRTTFSLDQMVM